MKRKVFALADIDSFYASVEANSLFRPDLKYSPVIVASNNDGCVVSRNRRAKALGIKMGAPLFSIADLIQKERVTVFSSNYALYANMTARVMKVLGTFTPDQEVYSCDESFLDLTGQDCNLIDLGFRIKQAVYVNTGLSVGVGISTTKTLAKLANYGAKKYLATKGVVDLTCPDRQARLLAITPVEEVWGVGRRIAARLKDLGIETAVALAEADTRFIRDQFSIVLEKTVRELRGESVMPLELIPPKQKQIVHSRAFGRPVVAFAELREAAHSYAVKAMEKARKQGLRVRTLSVFIQTSPFREQDYYYNSAVAQFPVATGDTRIVLSIVSDLLKSIWKENKKYIRAGVMLIELEPVGTEQLQLLDERDERAERLMQVMDSINSRGKARVYFASQGCGNQAWQMRRDFLSPSYLTRWQDIPVVS